MPIQHTTLEQTSIDLLVECLCNHKTKKGLFSNTRGSYLRAKVVRASLSKKNGRIM